MGFLKSTRNFKALSAAKEHTNEVRGGGRDPGVRRPGAGLGQSPARSKFFRAAMHFVFVCYRLRIPRPFFGRQLLLNFILWLEIHTASMPITSGTHTDGGAEIRKSGSAWPEDPPAVDHGINGKRTHMYSNKRE